MNYEKVIEQNREKKNLFFKTSPHSPLTKKQKKHFSALDYFEINSDLKYEVDLKLYENQQIIDIQTSTGQTQKYIRYGFFKFQIESHLCSLTVFKPPSQDYFFIPFKDKTTGHETYSSGRYVEVEKIRNNKFILDFNLAYNPFCAYNDKWTCPLTPFENNLDVEIKAGEKNFK